MRCAEPGRRRATVACPSRPHRRAAGPGPALRLAIGTALRASCNERPATTSTPGEASRGDEGDGEAGIRWWPKSTGGRSCTPYASGRWRVVDRFDVTHDGKAVGIGERARPSLSDRLRAAGGSGASRGTFAARRRPRWAESPLSSSRRPGTAGHGGTLKRVVGPTPVTPCRTHGPKPEACYARLADHAEDLTLTEPCCRDLLRLN